MFDENADSPTAAAQPPVPQSTPNDSLPSVQPAAPVNDTFSNYSPAFQQAAATEATFVPGRVENNVSTPPVPSPTSNNEAPFNQTSAVSTAGNSNLPQSGQVEHYQPTSLPATSLTELSSTSTPVTNQTSTPYLESQGQESASRSDDTSTDLEAVAFDLANLYLDSRLKVLVTGENHPEVWEGLTKKYPLYASRINDFFTTLKAAEKVKKDSYPEADGLMQKLNFHMVEKEATRMLLTDLLWRRVSDTGGKLERSVNFPEEAVAILREMGCNDTEIKEKIEISVYTAMRAILEGKLRVNRLPKV